MNALASPVTGANRLRAFFGRLTVIMFVGCPASDFAVVDARGGGGPLTAVNADGCGSPCGAVATLRAVTAAGGLRRFLPSCFVLLPPRRPLRRGLTRSTCALPASTALVNAALIPSRPPPLLTASLTTLPYVTLLPPYFDHAS